MVLIVLVAVSVVMALYRSQFGPGKSDDPAVWGQFGDYVGGTLNPFLSLLALIGVAVSLWYNAQALRASVEATNAAKDQLTLAQAQFEHERQEQGKRQEAERDAERKHRTFQLFETWNSPEMLGYRSTGGEMLCKALQDTSADQLIPIGRYLDKKPDGGYHAAVAVWQFLAGVNALLEAELLNEPLLWKLFDGSLEEWLSECHRVHFGREPIAFSMADRRQGFTGAQRLLRRGGLSGVNAGTIGLHRR